MGVVAGWLVVPLVLAVLVVGHGLAVERLSGSTLPGALLPGVGLASLIVVSGLLTISGATAPLAAPVAAVLALLGLVWARPWPRFLRRGVLLPAAVALGAFLVFAAPSLLSGQASIAGYLKLDDSATWLALTSHVVEHGRDLGGMAPSSYRRTVESWLGGGYPVGGFLPLGVAARLARQDAAGSYQSVMAVYAAVVALGISACFAPLARSRRRAAVIGVLAVQASTFYGYVQWGGIKEAACAALLPPLAFMAVHAWGAPGPRRLSAVAVVAGAVVGVLGVNGATWALPALAVALAGVLHRRRRNRVDPMLADADPRWPSRVLRSGIGWVALFGLPAAALAVASIPALVTIAFLRQTTAGGAVSDQQEVANLVRPLSLLQIGGLWPVPDFRFVGADMGLVVWMAFVCLLSAAAGVVLAFHRREGVAAAYAGIAAAGAIPALAIGSPWVDAKVMAIVSPVVLALAVCLAMAATATSDRFSRTLGTILLAVLVTGAAWSTGAVARDAYVAPRQRFAELQQLGTSLAGQGPTLVLDFEIYADRYFLRGADAEGATDLRYRRVSRRDGQLFPERSVADVDDVAVPDLWEYRTIVRRRSPVASRPPAGFTLVHGGRSWEAWQRPVAARPPVARLPLGGPGDPTAVPDCAGVEALSLTPGSDRLLVARRAPPVVVPLDAGSAPRSWRTSAGLSPGGDGRASTSVTVPVAGPYRVWVGGAVLGRLKVRVDGRPLGAATHELAHAGQWMRFGVLELGAGPHDVELVYSRGLRSGTGFPRPLLGPVALAPDAGDEVFSVPAASYRDLCGGSRYDWIEAEAPGGG